MKLKLVAASLFSLYFITTTVNAEYLGINELAIKQEDSPMVLLNAVKSLNYDLVKEWTSKDYKFKYDNKEWCTYTPNGLSKTDLKGRDMDFLVGVNKSSGGYLLPTSCDSIPIWHLIFGFNMMYSEDVAKYSDIVKKQSDYTSQVKLLNMYKLLEKTIPPENYQVYFPVIIDTHPPLEQRMEALTKFIQGYKKHNEYLTEAQKAYEEAVKRYADSNPSPNSGSYIYSVTDPGFVILSEIVTQFIDEEYDYYKYYSNHSDLKLPKFTMEDIKNGGVDLSQYDLSKIDYLVVKNILTLNGYLKMIKEVLDSKIVDINFQDLNGNTILHSLMSNKYRTLKNNALAGSFIRYLLENGINPLLNNKANQTAYYLFEKEKGSDQSVGSMKITDAFIQKNFED